MLKRELGSLGMRELDRERLVTFGRRRAAEGAGPYSVYAGQPIEGPACVAASGYPTASRHEIRAP